MADSEVTAAVQKILDAAYAVYSQMADSYAADAVAKALAPGGEIYEQLLGGAISGAMTWYGMYNPVMYQRGMTMTNPANIAISGSAQASGGTITGTFSVANVSPHAGYSEGFWMIRRGRPFFRPAGDLMQDVPGSVNINVEIPQADVDTMFAQALKAVL